MIRLFSILLITSITFALSAQVEKLVVEGAIVIADNDNQNPVAGTIRWSGTDFEGFDGTNWISLTCCDSKSPIDCDGNKYQTIKIGDQTWFAENLRTTCYNDGSPIPFKGDHTSWLASEANAQDAFTFYNFSTTDDSGHGGFYNWYSVDNAYNSGRNVCPVGWHVPSSAEFEILKAELNGDEITDIAGGRAKSNSLAWNQPNEGTFDSGFLAEPCPRCTGSVSFSSSGTSAYFLTTSLDTSRNYIAPYNYWLLHSSERFRRVQPGSADGSGDGAPIRCLKD